MRERTWIPQAVLSIMLLWALNDANPYGYYLLLRLVCTGVFAFLTYRSSMQGSPRWAWAFGLTAALYNPFIPAHLDRATWSIINVATVALAIASFWVIQKPLPHPHEAR